MTSVFIIRPFGKKSVTVKDKDGKDTSVEVDFNHIDQSLIQAALTKNGLKGKTTEAIAEAGNIRLDMFQMLIAYDLVIADISVDNANVFYELGIRHGLRPKGTILIRFPTSGKDVPFDLKTDRYIAYDRENPAGAVDLLAKSIKETIQSMRSYERKADSPVFLLLPELIPPDPENLLVVPKEFQEAVEKAEKDAPTGRTTLACSARRRDRTSGRGKGCGSSAERSAASTRLRRRASHGRSSERTCRMTSRLICSWPPFTSASAILSPHPRPVVACSTIRPPNARTEPTPAANWRAIRRRPG